MVSRSSTEAEYIALASVSSEITWQTHVLQDLQIPRQAPALIYCDNHASISIASNPIFHECTKHIEIDCHFIHDKIQQGQQKLLSIKSSHQLADMFTKPLPLSTIHELMFKMEIRNLYTPS
ncbi:putative mitochondrial protein [Cucumis melo var. makuwa]|uniref:Mitochondrial protein n=1 Tax=Cucumis melo var. makuwa TaxID=1194695 RepID=A0A5D3DK31_CUCMM|nr:putative mitochondrial protein [Cucumis melo var. makuwa]TYK23619.1 putative mitochondrial protein [Cucumis melo var. makuwa]